MSTVGILDGQLTRELRRSVLRPALAPDAPLPGDDVPDGVHFGATDAGAVVCTCFVYADPCPWLPERPAWHLRQMATAPQRRGEGLGADVVAAAADYVRSQGAELLWCNARESAVGFYARCGFAAHGGSFTDEQHPIPHRRMVRELSPAPTSSAG